ncbi:hypothetical protein J2752_002214 [Halarchaeum rubridurum]|uniref:Uncharacterized protein n=1 Tax=Halarchaeum rubridurum TaxID=489911 RepID=A0A830G1M0_9EURY|nr:DUF5797 family protein [Halarchaeum rubridurum]MBP1955291.1 hypothetical protein [Halarchaeum rubridurum]GGM71067.1 hypothetical protein GCM10009017_21470 [Halarchaeum rubridurum]
MTLSEEAAERLADIVELQPTKNKALQDRWGMESGSDVHQYLESELKEYYYRDEDSLIRATAEARAIVTGEEPEEFEVHMTDFERLVFAVAPGPEEESASVVNVLHRLREAHGDDLETDDGDEPGAKDVRRALQALKRKGVVELIYRTVPTFRLAVERDAVLLDED